GDRDLRRLERLAGNPARLPLSAAVGAGDVAREPQPCLPRLLYPCFGTPETERHARALPVTFAAGERAAFGTRERPQRSPRPHAHRPAADRQRSPARLLLLRDRDAPARLLRDRLDSGGRAARRREDAHVVR